VKRSPKRAALSVRLRGLADRLLDSLLERLTGWGERSSIDRFVARGACVGRLWVRCGLPRTYRVRDQLAAAFPELSNAGRSAWTSGVFEHFGRSLAELILLRGRHRQDLLERVEIEGLEHLLAAETSSATGGVLIVSAHYGNWELAGVKLATRGIPISAVFRGLSQRVLDEALWTIRSGEGFPAVDYEQIRMGNAGIGVVRALKRGRKVLVLLDQNAGREAGLFVPFFGRPARVRTGPLRLASRCDVPILPAFMRRDPKGSGHLLRIHPPLLPEKAAEGEADDEPFRVSARELTSLIEAEIRQDPTQWIWTHRRWRTQPDETRPDSLDP
jgi:Kdo2-lipid IVA lauroyltransferase/acyltransferase